MLQSFGCLLRKRSSEAKPGVPKARRGNGVSSKHTLSMTSVPECPKGFCLRCFDIAKHSEAVESIYAQSSGQS